jgi:hypothetical protein
MKEYEKGCFFLELPEIIRVNQLVRNQINLGDFKGWYAQLSAPEQQTLISALFEFAYQAGVDEQVWKEALNTGNLEINNEMVQTLKSFHVNDLGLHDWGGFQDWLVELLSPERDTLFVLAVFLFGTAEGKVFSKEQKDWCNHWWHRDLLDKRVVEALLTNPRFYITSMKDDDEIKKGLK